MLLSLELELAVVEWFTVIIPSWEDCKLCTGRSNKGLLVLLWCFLGAELWPPYVIYRWPLYAVNLVRRITAALLGLPLLAAIYRVAGLLRWQLTPVSLYYLFRKLKLLIKHISMRLSIYAMVMIWSSFWLPWNIGVVTLCLALIEPKGWLNVS